MLPEQRVIVGDERAVGIMLGGSGREALADFCGQAVPVGLAGSNIGSGIDHGRLHAAVSLVDSLWLLKGSLKYGICTCRAGLPAESRGIAIITLAVEQGGIVPGARSFYAAHEDGMAA